MEKQESYFILPNIISLKDLNLKYKDLLTYSILRMHMNNETKTAFPSLQVIATKSGLSILFISQSIKRLKNANLIWVNKSKTSRVNVYSFNDITRFKMIPISLISETSLTTDDKAILVAIRQFFHDDNLTTSKSIDEIAKALDLNYYTLQRHISQLKDRGILTTALRYTVEIINDQKIPVNKTHITLNEEIINWRLQKIEIEVKHLQNNAMELIAILEATIKESKLKISTDTQKRIDTLKNTSKVLPETTNQLFIS